MDTTTTALVRQMREALSYIADCSAPMTSQQNECWPVMRRAIVAADEWLATVSVLETPSGSQLLPYLGPWCCPSGQQLGVQVCPDCAEASAAYSADMAPVISANTGAMR